MKFKSVACMVLGTFLALACSSGGESPGQSLGTASEGIVGPSTLGGPDQVVMIYEQVELPDGEVVTRTCSGAYFAPRVVATAAHCLQNISAGQLFVYYGNNFDADFNQLTPGPNGFEPPAPGQPSFWSKADSFESHPNYDPTQHFPDIGFVYLDRKLPFDPLPLSRTVLPANRSVTISGWGANTTPTPTTGLGTRVQRTGTSRAVGSPTAADFHPEDPNAGLLVAADRAAQIKLDATPPNANSCFGDSGSPLLINQFGQTYVAGINYFTGLSCADYSLYTRISSFLPFFDEAYKKGGQEVLKPTFDCVAPNAQGTLTAFFGYDNQNGVSVTVPLGSKNNLPRDSGSQRPTRFLPGAHHFDFSVDFAANQSVLWTLSPENSPTTTLTVNQSSRRCGAVEATQTECGLSCRASQRSGCAGLPTFDGCMSFCTQQIADFSSPPACVVRNRAFDVCTASVSPDPANWECIEDFGAVAVGPCAAEIDALNNCFSE